MAEMNDLLDQAIQECEGLSDEAEAFASVLDRFVADYTGLEGSALRRSRDVLHRLDRTLDGLRERDRRADAADEEARQHLASIDREIDAAESETQEALEAFTGLMRELVEERERIADELRAGHEAAREELEELRARLESLERRAEEQLQRAEEAIARVEEAVAEAMESFGEAREELSRRFEQAEAAVEELTGQLEEAFDHMIERGQAALAALREGLEARVEEAAAAVTQLFGEEAPEVLRASFGELSAGLEALLDAGAQGDRDAGKDLTAAIQKQQQALQLMSGISRLLHDTMTGVIRKIAA